MPNRDAGGVKHYEQINLLSDSEDEPNCCGERTPRVDRGSQYDATNSTPIEIHTKQMQDAGNAQLRINQGTAHLAGCSTRYSAKLSKFASFNSTRTLGVEDCNEF